MEGTGENADKPRSRADNPEHNDYQPTNAVVCAAGVRVGGCEEYRTVDEASYWGSNDQKEPARAPPRAPAQHRSDVTSEEADCEREPESSAPPSGVSE